MVYNLNMVEVVNQKSHEIEELIMVNLEAQKKTLQES